MDKPKNCHFAQEIVLTHLKTFEKRSYYENEENCSSAAGLRTVPVNVGLWRKRGFRQRQRVKSKFVCKMHQVNIGNLKKCA